MGWLGEEKTIAISDEERMEAEAAAVVSCVMNVSVAAASRPCLAGSKAKKKRHRHRRNREGTKKALPVRSHDRCAASPSTTSG